MAVSIDGNETAMAILNGLPSQFENTIKTPAALGDVSSVFIMDIVRSRLLQVEQRREMRHTNVSELFPLFSNQSKALTAQTYYWNHCKRRGHTEKRCWDKNLLWRLKENDCLQTSLNSRALPADTNEYKILDDEKAVCLFSQNLS